MTLEVPGASVKMVLTKHISTACYLCRKRNGNNEGYILMDLLIGRDWPDRPEGVVAARDWCGYTIYCVDCYEMLRRKAAELFKGFIPFYELVYDDEIMIEFPPELVCSARDPFRFWRKDLDVDGWLKKLDEERAGNPNS